MYSECLISIKLCGFYFILELPRHQLMSGLFVLFPERRKSKVRRSKSRYKMLEADEQDSLELQPPRVGKTRTKTL